MKLNVILTAVAASALMSGAAFAQATDQAAPSTTTSTPSATSPPSTDPASPAGQSTTSNTTGAPTADTSSATSPAAPAADTGAATSTSATTSDTATGASVTNTLTTNGPVPDTAENRAKYGGPMSRAGKRSAAKGN